MTLVVWVGGAMLAGLGGVMLGVGSQGVQWNMGFTLLLTMFAAIVLVEVLVATELLGPAYERLDLLSVERGE